VGKQPVFWAFSLNSTRRQLLRTGRSSTSPLSVLEPSKYARKPNLSYSLPKSTLSGQRPVDPLSCEGWGASGRVHCNYAPARRGPGIHQASGSKTSLSLTFRVEKSRRKIVSDLGGWGDDQKGAGPAFVAKSVSEVLLCFSEIELVNQEEFVIGRHGLSSPISSGCLRATRPWIREEVRFFQWVYCWSTIK